MESRNATLALITIIGLVFLTQMANSAGIVRSCWRMSRSYRTLSISTHSDDRTIDIQLLSDTGEKSVAVHCGPAECRLVLSSVSEPTPAEFVRLLRS